MKRTALKRRKGFRVRPKPARVIQADIWRGGLGPCVVCGARYDVDAHHVIYAQTLRRHGHTDQLMCLDNRVALCRRHHERHHNRTEPLGREFLPEQVFAFAAALNLGWWLDKHYPAERAAA